MTVHQTAPCKTEGCENPKPRNRGVRYCPTCQESYETGRKARRKPVQVACANCGQPKSKGAGRRLCDDCSAHCEEHVSYNYKCTRCTSRNSVRSTRMKEYGLTLHQVIELEKIRECQVCGSGYRLCVDHDHDTGEVRGILCDLCNKALGMARDRSDILDGLSTYLKGYGK